MGANGSGKNKTHLGEENTKKSPSRGPEIGGKGPDLRPGQQMNRLGMGGEKGKVGFHQARKERVPVKKSCRSQGGRYFELKGETATTLRKYLE